jgi:hypothetical protein
MEHAITTILPVDVCDKPQDGEDSPTEGLSPSPSEGNVEMIDIDDDGDDEWRQRTSGKDRAERPSNEKLLVSHCKSF